MYIHLGIRERETLVVYTFGKNAQGGRPLEIKQYGNTIVVLPVGIDNFRVEDPWGLILRVEDPWRQTLRVEVPWSKH